MRKFNVGDTVIHVEPSYHRGPATITERTIRKVGRKYAYLNGPWNVEKVPFGRWDGIEHTTGGYSNYLERIYTPADWEAKERREKVLEAVKDAGIQFKGYGDPPYDTETLERLLAVVQPALDSKPGVTVL